jgi:predicted transport protein
MNQNCMYNNKYISYKAYAIFLKVILAETIKKLYYFLMFKNF